MERLTICRICLNANVSLLIPDTPLQELYEKLTSMPFQSTLKPSLICYVCHTQLCKASMLMQQCLRAEEFLKQRLNQLLTSEDTVQQKSIDTDKTEAPPLTCASVQQMQIESPSNAKEKTSVTYEEDIIDVITEIKSEDNRKIVKTEVTPLICAAVQQIHKDELPHVKEKASVIYEEDTTHIKTEVENDEVHKIDETRDTPFICTAVQQIHINSLHNAKERSHVTYDEHFIDIKIKIENEESEKIDNIEVTPFIRTAIHQIHIDSLPNTKERTHVTCERDVIDVETEVKNKEVRPEPDDDLHLALDHSDIDDEQISSDPEDDIPLNSIKERIDGVFDEQNVTRAVSTEPIGWDTGNPVVKKTRPSKDNSIIADVSSYVCKICDKSFTQICRLQTHERVHTGDKPYVCKICGKGFTQTGNLHRHERVHAGDRPYSCTICDKRFNRMCSLRKHEIIHTAGRLYSCKTCDKGFADISNLKRHERLHTGERLHVCKVCDKRFTQIGYLETHERGHTGDRAYSCKICDKRFTQIRSLRTHERLHTGVGLHICKVCDKRFTGLWSLQRHNRVHSGERPYICKICYKSFSLKGQLKTHDLIHTGDKPHSCKICHKRFTVKGNLQRHERIHTDKKPCL